MEKGELRFQILSALAESRSVGPEQDPDIAARYAERIATGPGSTERGAAPSTGRGELAEVVSAILASLIGLAGVVYATRQFASATALYGFYPAGSHGRLVLAFLALCCVGLSAGAILHAVFAMRVGLPLLVVSSVALIAGAMFVAAYTGPSDTSLEYTQLIPAGAVALLSVMTAALAAISTVTALAHARPLRAR